MIYHVPSTAVGDEHGGWFILDLLDDRGRLFGLVNVVDALVVLLVAAVVVAGVAFVLQPAPEPPEPSESPEPPETTPIQVTLQMTDVQPYLSDAIREGMSASDGNQTIATITEVERSPSTLIVTDQNGQVLVREHPTREDLSIVARIETHETAGGFTFKEEPVEIGSTITLDLGNVTIDGTVTAL